MSCHSPGSWAFTNTDAEMCIAETSTMPSWIPAPARHFSTSSVMSMISWRRFVLKVRYAVWNFLHGRAAPAICCLRGPARRLACRLPRALATVHIFYETTFFATP